MRKDFFGANSNGSWSADKFKFIRHFRKFNFPMNTIEEIFYVMWISNNNEIDCMNIMQSTLFLLSQKACMRFFHPAIILFGCIFNFRCCIKKLIFSLYINTVYACAIFKKNWTPVQFVCQNNSFQHKLNTFH